MLEEDDDGVEEDDDEEDDDEEDELSPLHPASTEIERTTTAIIANKDFLFIIFTPL